MSKPAATAAAFLASGQAAWITVDVAAAPYSSNHPQQRNPVMAVNQAAMRRRARIMRAVNVPMRVAAHGFCIVRWHLAEQG